MSKIIPIEPISTTDIVMSDGEDKHVQIAKSIEQILVNQKTTAQKNLTPVPIHCATRTKKIALAVAPMWGAQIAPYGVARMAGLSRSSGFETKCWDVNIQCYNEIPNFWSYLVDWKWANKEVYKNEIHPAIIHILEKFLTELVSFKPDIVGFTTYYTNINCTLWLVSQIKERLPGVKIIAGGPEARFNVNDRNSTAELFDYVVQGEGEMIFSQLLNDLDNDVPRPEKFLRHDKSIKIDLDSMPIPDYRDFDINLYQWKGIASEVSRGCIAKCTFCNETTFWRYRGRLSSNVLDEIEYNYKTFGIEVVWFIDSLVNGNLKELLALAQGLIDRNIKIRWWGFCRNDGRMDRAYLKTLLDSGCMGLAVGVESGSQKVIDLIQKKVNPKEIEQNFNDLAELGSFTNSTTWFVGFPGELPVDLAQTLTLVWRLRNAGVQNKGFGMCNLDESSPISLQRDLYNISPTPFGGTWMTNDCANTIAHRIIRYKSVQVLLNHYRLHRVRPQLAGSRGEQTGFLSHYKLNYNIDNWIDDIPYEVDFDFNIIKSNINPLADSLVNEIWPVLRVLWLATGPFTLALRFDPESDHPIYGDFRYFPAGAGGIWADYKFNIDEHGNWSADFYTKLNSTLDTDCKYNFEYHWVGAGCWTRPGNN